MEKMLNLAGLLRRIRVLRLPILVQASGTEGQRDLRRDSLAQAFKKHPYGREYAVMTHEEATKNHPGGAKRSFKIII